ncbi:MAG TPA: efflux RND transporter periplasmic adaptor subunit [Gammaproteobacteria bacterium]|nr:efflux RND transporter periplasmic adaptor subunit [Gammaproteobacteria bacterium]
MSTSLRLLAVVLSLALSACERLPHIGHDHPPDQAPAHEEDNAALAYTHYTDQTELFVEFPALVVGRSSRFLAHVTRLADFKPLTAGTLDVVLEGPAGPVARFRVREPARDGLFLPVVSPRDPGTFRLVVEIEANGLQARHDLGPVTVSAAAGDVVIPDGEQEGEIVYLKEQQWADPFATWRVAPHPLRRSVPGFATVLAPADAGAQVHAPTDGYVAATRLARGGSSVAQGDVLGYLVPRLGEGTDSGTLRVALEQAESRLTLAERDVSRLEQLYAQGAVPERRLAEARGELGIARAEATAARARIKQTQQGDGQAGLALRAPVAGTIVETNARPGAFTRAGERLFRIAAPERRWVEIRVPEHFANELPTASGAWLDAGEHRNIVLDAATGAQVVQVSTAIDPSTRTASVTMEYPTVQGPEALGIRLPAGVFVSEPTLRLALPRSAVIEDGGRDVVYVQTGGESFARRPVELGIRDGELVEVLSGVEASERVVSKGAYLVRLAAVGGDEIGHGHTH